MKLTLTLIFLVALTHVIASEVDTNAIISNNKERDTSFRPTTPGKYTFGVRVTDGCSSFFDTVQYDIICEEKPKARAGDSQTATMKCGKPTTVLLDGTSSTSSGETTYQWTFCGKPEGSQLEDEDIAHNTHITAFFTPDVTGDYCVDLEVTDCCDTVHSTTNVNFSCNDKPRAKVVGDQEVELKSSVKLDGSGSDDADGDVLRYEWSFIKVPSDSNVRESDIESENYENSMVFFYPDVAGNYIVQLAVSDCCNTDTKQIVINAACNSPPMANAGEEEYITGIQQVTLDGSSSVDPDGDHLTFSWKFFSLPPTSKLEDRDIEGFDVKKATFLPDVLGVYEIALEVSDCCTTVQSRKKVIVGCNDPPVACAGGDKTVTGTRPFSSVELNGCDCSSDPNDDALTYSWSIVSKPDSSAVSDYSISGGKSCAASFVPDVLGMYELQISISDFCTVTNDTVRVIVGCNHFPQADAGVDQTVAFTCAQSRINLDGSASSDEDEDDLKYEWRFSAIPEGSSARDHDISNSNEKWSSFVPDVLGVYELILTVTDSCTRDTDKVRIVYSCNASPRANAGPDRVETGTFPWEGDILLDGSQSSDPDSDDLRFTWSFISVPEDSSLTSASIVGPHLSRPTFKPDVPGRYEVEVVVSDCCSSCTDRIIIKVSCGDPPTANAGNDQFLIQSCGENQKLIEIDGASSYDPDGSDLHYNWRFVKVPEGSSLSDNDIQGVDNVKASFLISPYDRINESDEYILELAVSDTCRTVYDQVKITYCCNDPPTANAGVDHSFAAAPPFPPVQLNGGDSSDPNNDHLVYQWAFTSRPVDSYVNDGQIIDSNSATTSFIPDVRGIYELELRVQDCCSTKTDRVKITVTCDNPPTANAGPDKAYEHYCDRQNVISVDGSASFDPDVEPLSFEWAFYEIPEGSTLTDAALDRATSDVASFTPDVTGDYDLKLTVSDGCSVVSDRVRISYSCDARPTAVADDIDAIVSNPPFPPIHLTGVGSSDPSGSIQNYEWEFTSLPLGSKLLSEDITHSAPSVLGGTFTPDSPGCYDVQLNVQGCCAAAHDETRVCISCNDAPVAIAGKDQEFVKGATRPQIELDGCQSNDPDGDDLTYGWRFSRKPIDTTLDDNDIFRSGSCNPTFSPDVTGVYEIELTVFDGCTPSRDKVLVKYRCNHAPDADAGPDRSVVKSCNSDSIVELDASGTTDQDNDPLDFSWKFVRVPVGSTIDDDSINNRTSARASFTPDTFGPYELEVTVEDYCFAMKDTVLVTYHCNDAPYANAGTDQDITAYPYPMINLYGTRSHDTDGDNVEYNWEFIHVPPTSHITNDNIVDSNLARAIFLPDVAGVYMISLSVCDCCSCSTDEVKITLNRKGCNAQPVADAGDDQESIKMCNDDGVCNCEVQLDGSGSYDDDGDNLAYKWKFTRKPTTSMLGDGDILSSNSPNAEFTPDIPGEYMLQLVISDGCSQKADEVSVNFRCNDSPVADAGTDRQLQTEGTSMLPKVVVDGSDSYDPDNDKLDYEWTFVSTAEGSCLTDLKLNCNDNGQCHFYPDVRGCYELKLTVTDCCSSHSDTVEVCITCNSAPKAYAGLDRNINSCPPFPHVELEGKDDSEFDQDNHIWSWKFVNKPAESLLTDDNIDNSNTARAQFSPDVMGTYELELTIADGCSTDTDTVTVHVGCNTGPQANAGKDSAVRWDGNKFPKVALDGTASTDPEDDELSYSWKFSSRPVGSKLTNDDISQNREAIASFWPDVSGTFELELTVADCCSPAHDKVKVHVSCNGVPSVVAGETKTIKKSCSNTLVTLDGQANDPDGDPLTYQWKFTSLPPGSRLSDNKINSARSPAASFTPDITGSFFELQLTVSDGCTVLADRVKVEYECNDPPTSDAGKDQNIIKGCTDTVVHLDGTGSSDPENDPLSFNWKFTNLPVGSKVNGTLAAAETANPTFTPDVVGLYELELVVSDCCEVPAMRCTCMKDRVLVSLSCEGAPPSPNAGEDMVVNWDEQQFPTVFLDGSESSDPDNDRIDFEWSFVHVPEKSHRNDNDIHNRNAATPTFVPDVNGEYVLSLTVSDCCYSEVDQVTVSVKCDNPPTAKAGPDQELTRSCQGCGVDNCQGGSPVFLDGSGSSDPENEALTCSWRFVCQPVKSTLTDAEINESSSMNAFFYADVLGEYVLELTCFDGCSYVTDEVVARVGCNGAPEAVATTSTGEKVASVCQDCGDNELVVLDGSGSTDPDEDTLFYSWSFLDKPTNSKLEDTDIISRHEATAYFRADMTGEYILELTAADCCQHSSTTLTINVACGAAPVANAGAHKNLEWDGVSATHFTLDGSESSDPDSENLRYRWKLVNGPSDNTNIEIDRANHAIASFSPDDFGEYVFELEVSDCCSSDFAQASVSVTCNNATRADAGNDDLLEWNCDRDFTLSVDFDGKDHNGIAYEWSILKVDGNSVPVVDAGCDYEGSVGDIIHLDHATATDEDNAESLSFSWEIEERPSASRLTNADIHARHNRQAFFTPDAPGVYSIKLTVSDGHASASDYAKVYAEDNWNSFLSSENTKTEPLRSSDSNTLKVAVYSLVGIVATLAALLAGVLVHYRKEVSRDLRNLRGGNAVPAVTGDQSKLLRV